MQEKKQNISPVKQRILQFVDTLGISKRDFYAIIGVSRGTLESKTGITEDVMAKFIAKYPEVNIVWLITGNGEMLDLDKGTHRNKSEIIYQSDPRDAELIASNRETIETQRKLIASLEDKIAELEKSARTTKSSRNITGLRSVPAADSIYPNQTGVKPKRNITNK